jgi:hypothetical protein
MQTFVIWFIDGSSYIDVDDPKWRFYMLYADSQVAVAHVCGGHVLFLKKRYMPWAAAFFRTVLVITASLWRNGSFADDAGRNIRTGSRRKM